MTASNSFICGIVLLVFLNMAAILAFASPYWIVESVYTGTSQNRHGLFFECGSHKLCQANDNLQFGLADGTEGQYIHVHRSVAPVFSSLEGTAKLHPQNSGAPQYPAQIALVS